MYTLFERIVDIFDFVDSSKLVKEKGELFSAKQLDIINYVLTEEEPNYDYCFKEIYKGPNKSSFDRLLMRLEKQIIDTDILIRFNTPSKEKSYQNKTSQYREYVMIQMIRDQGFERLASYYSEKLLNRANKSQYFDLVYLLCNQLEFYYSFNEFNSEKAAYYKVLKTEINLNSGKIQEVSMLYFKLVQLISLGKQINDQGTLNELAKDLSKTLVLKNELMSYPLAQRVYSNISLYHLIARNYQGMYNASQEGLSFFFDNFPNRPVQQFMFQLRMAVAKIHLLQFVEARALMLKVLEMNPTPGHLHWNSAYSYAFVLEMLTKNYQDATDILIDMVTEPKLNNLEDIWIQQWRIRSAYIHFLAKIGLVDLERIGKKRVPNFRLGKFLNEVPTYSKDKRGLNISIIIAQFLILLADRKFGKIYDRIDALSKYSYRHLKNDDKLRSNCFIRMLLSLAKAEFNPVRAQRYAKKYVEKLKTTEMNLNEYSTEIEIIPYEDLWEIILQLVDQKKKVKLA